VIGHAVYDAQGATQTFELNAYEFVELALHAWMDEWFIVFCGPYGMDPDS
jgi:hypothetical protein